MSNIKTLDLDSTEELSSEQIRILKEEHFRYSGNSSNPPLSGQPYRLVDVESFPHAHYVLTTTGNPINKVFEVSQNVYEIDVTSIMSIIDDFSFEEIHKRDYYGSDYHSTSKIFEKRDRDGVTLLTIYNIFNDWAKGSKSKYHEGINIAIHSNGNNVTYKEITEKIINACKRKVLKSNNIALVIQTQRGYETQTFELPKQKLDIELNYGKDFKPIHEKIIGQLNKQKSKGLVLLHGTPGTGKTHYLKYLASKIKDKRVLFIPPYLADFITSPQMTPFLIENANSVLFIEDAENVITDRTSNGSTGVSNILNLTDGILSDILNIQIVATFNMDKKKIDTALLRKGRLIAEHKFEALPLDDTKALLKHLGKDVEVKNGMTLTEIYNIDETEYKSEEKYSPIGFNR
jgi:hypothetical protein